MKQFLSFHLYDQLYFYLFLFIYHSCYIFLPIIPVACPLSVFSYFSLFSFLCTFYSFCRYQNLAPLDGMKQTEETD
jgi:hypothetical protein